MPFFDQHGYRIAGIATAVPANKVYNKDLDWIEPDHLQKLIESVGVIERRICQNGQKLSDLSLAAANGLLTKLNQNPQEIGVLLLVTQTGDHQIPSTALALHAKLNLPQDCLALEINLGCSGYVYGLWLIQTLLNAIPAKKYGLLVVGDVSSICLAPNDTGTVPLFSDASSATLIERDEQAGPWHFNLKNDGVNREAIKMFGTSTFEHIGNAVLRLDGLKIYSFSLSQVVPSVNELLSKLQLEVSDISYFVFHQASRIINEAIRRKLGIPAEQFPYSLPLFGNTSSATIPITICTELRERVSKGSSQMMLTGFGTGLSWGSVVMDIGPATIMNPIEI